MKSTFKKVADKVTNMYYKSADVIAPIGCVALTAATALSGNIVMAGDGGVSDLMGLIIDILAGLVIALAVIMAIVGFIHYAQANSEGDGPAKQKATMQLASAVMLIAVSVLIKVNKDKFVEMVAHITDQ